MKLEKVKIFLAKVFLCLAYSMKLCYNAKGKFC